MTKSTTPKRRIAPSRWAVYELDALALGSQLTVPDGAQLYWLRSTATEDLDGWVERQAEANARVAPGVLGTYRADWTERYSTRTTKESLRELRATIATAITKAGGHVVPDAPREVYVIELTRRAPDGRTQLYVGETSDLEKRLAEHRGEIPDGTPGGHAVRRYGFGRLRPDLVGHVALVHPSAARELESQVSALLAFRGFKVHGDGAKRAPTSTCFVRGVSWGQLHGAWAAANPKHPDLAA